MSQTRNAGAILKSNTVTTGISLAVVVRMLELAIDHMIVGGDLAPTWNNVVGYLTEYEVQMVGTTLILWASNHIRAWGIGQAVDATIAARVKKWLGSPIVAPKGEPDGSAPATLSEALRGQRVPMTVGEAIEALEARNRRTQQPPDGFPRDVPTEESERRDV